MSYKLDRKETEVEESIESTQSMIRYLRKEIKEVDKKLTAAIIALSTCGLISSCSIIDIVL